MAIREMMWEEERNLASLTKPSAEDRLSSELQFQAEKNDLVSDSIFISVSCPELFQVNETSYSHTWCDPLLLFPLALGSMHGLGARNRHDCFQLLGWGSGGHRLRGPSCTGLGVEDEDDDEHLGFNLCVSLMYVLVVLVVRLLTYIFSPSRNRSVRWIFCKWRWGGGIVREIRVSYISCPSGWKAEGADRYHPSPDWVLYLPSCGTGAGHQSVPEILRIRANSHRKNEGPWPCAKNQHTTITIPFPSTIT